MPIIGCINVPEELWKELIKVTILTFQTHVLEDVADILSHVAASRRLTEMNSHFEVYYAPAEQQLVALIREQTGKPHLSIDAITQSDAYLNIWQAAQKIGHPVSFEAMFNFENMRALADEYVRKM